VADDLLQYEVVTKAPSLEWTDARGFSAVSKAPTTSHNKQPLTAKRIHKHGTCGQHSWGFTPYCDCNCSI